MPLLEKEYGFKYDENNEVKAFAEAEKKEDDQPELLSHEKVSITDAAVMEVINHYCGHEAGVRNLRKALDRVFRKIVAKLESQPASAQVAVDTDVEYQINTLNLEQFLDVPPTDDNYY